MIITDPTHSLVFGLLNLVGTDADLGTLGYKITVEGDDADWGNPVPILKAVQSWLQDGAIEGLEGFGNREMYLRIKLQGVDDEGLAKGEAALVAETYKRNQLVWVPPGENAEASVFSVVMSELEQVTDDQGERRYERMWGLKLTAEPFVRASYSLSAVAVPEFVVDSGEEPATTVVDDGSSTSGWAMSPTRSGTVTSSGGQVRLNTSTTSASATQGLRRTGLTEDLTDQVYVRVKITRAQALLMPRWTGHKVPPPATLTQSVSYLLNGVTVTPAFVLGQDYYFPLDNVGSALNTVEVRVTASHNGPIGPSGYGLRFLIDVSEIAVTNTANADGSDGRQVSAVVDVAGTVRTIGNLAIEYNNPAPGGFYPLGECLVYTCPDTTPGYWPGMRAYTTAAAEETVDASLISDSWIPINSTDWRVDYPVAQIPPGGYVLMARIRRATAGSSVITITTGVNDGTNDVGPTQVDTWAGALTTDWEILPLATLMLPVADIGSAGTVWVELGTESGDEVRVDEGWLFNIETGQLTHVELPVGGDDGPSRMWLNAPSIDRPRPQILVGNASDGSDAYHPGNVVRSFGVHEFRPPRAKVFLASTGAGSGVPQITLTHNPRFHTHVTPAPDGATDPLLAASGSLNLWTYPGVGESGDMMFALGFVALDAIVTNNGWTLEVDDDIEGVDYRLVLLSKAWDGTTTMPTVAAAALPHLLISGVWENATSVDAIASFQSTDTGIFAPDGATNPKLSAFAYTAPALDLSAFVLQRCTNVLVVDAPGGGLALLQLTANEPLEGTPYAGQPDTETDYDVNWFAMSIGFS